MLTNKILACISLGLLVLCFCLSLTVFYAKPKGKVLGVLAGMALLSMVCVTAISSYLFFQS